MVLTAACGLFHLAFAPWEGMPYAMWALLEPGASCVDAMRIILLLPCLLDSWSQNLIREFCSPVVTLEAAAQTLLDLVSELC